MLNTATACWRATTNQLKVQTTTNRKLSSALMRRKNPNRVKRIGPWLTRTDVSKWAVSLRFTDGCKVNAQVKSKTNVAKDISNLYHPM